MPKSWNDISVSQYQEIYDTENNEGGFNIHLLSVIADISVEEIEELPYDEYVQMFDDISFINTPPRSIPKPFITTPAGLLYLINDLNQIQLGEFIDLENLFTQGFIKNIQVILAILYRQKEMKKSLLYVDEYEKYGDWIFHRAPLFNDININDVYGVIPKYLEFRTNILESYSGLFDESGSDEEEEFDPNESVIARSERRKEEGRQKSLKKWGWDIFLLKIAQNDPTKLDLATKMPLLQALNILSMKKELGLPD